MWFSANETAVIADVHLGIKRASERWHAIHLEWAKDFKKKLKIAGIKNIVVSGDWFHYRDDINVQTLHTSNEILNSWKDFSIFILAGNHDCYYKDHSKVNSLSIFKGRKNVQVVDELFTFEQYGKKIAFVPWGVELKDVPKSDIIFGHFNLTSFKMSAGSLCDHGIDPMELADYATTVFTGHFHLRQERTYKNSKITYTGNPFQMDFGDVGDTKGFYILDIATEQFRFVENTISPKHIVLNDWEYRTSPNISGNLIRVKLSWKYIDSEINKNGQLKPEEVNDAVLKLLDDVRIFVHSKKPLECFIEREPTPRSTIGHVSTDAAVSISQIANELVDSMKYEYADDLKKKLTELMA